VEEREFVAVPSCTLSVLICEQLIEKAARVFQPWVMRYCLTLAAFAGILLSAGCEKNAATAAPPAPAAATNANVNPTQFHLNRAQPKLRTIKLWIGTQEIDTEAAVSITEISTGMMFRTNMEENTGMLFLFTGPDRRSFYMKNCVINLSAAYIDTEGVIDQIVDLHKGVETPVPSRSDQIKYVLEMPQGWFSRHNVTTGMVINTSQGMLKNLRGVLR
jgi:uncharacterized membrane protein (UPF0127 family)